MGQPLSDDLRARALAAVDGGMSRRAAAERFGVSAASVIRWDQRRRAEGHFKPRAQGGDMTSRRIEAHAGLILATLASRPDVTLHEMAAVLAEAGASFSIWAIRRFYLRRKITLKKRSGTPASRTVPTS